MTKFRISQEKFSLQGLTLIEGAVFLCTAGIVLGAIWSAASTVHRKATVLETYENITKITLALQTLYANTGSFSGATGFNIGDDVTDKMINAKIVPASMFDENNPTTPITPWGTDVDIFVGPTLDTFRIALPATLPKDACFNLVALSIGINRNPSLDRIVFDNHNFTGNALRNRTLSDITSTGNCSHISFTYKLRG